MEEVTGEAIENRHRMSVVMGVIDAESMKHTSAFQGAKMRAGGVLQRKVIEFANLMSTGTRAMDSMEIGRLERQRQQVTAARRAGQEEDENWQESPLAAAGCIHAELGATGSSSSRPSSDLSCRHKMPQVWGRGPLRVAVPQWIR